MSEDENCFEDTIKKNFDDRNDLPGKLDINILKYFWLVGPISGNRKDNIPKFLRRLRVLKNLSDNELRLFSKFLHMRKFEPGEKIFRQNQPGFGCYFIYSGLVDIIVEGDGVTESGNAVDVKSRHVVSLERGDYFGELALLQDESLRNATAVAQHHTVLLGVFKPDLEEIIQTKPVLGAKFLQSVSQIIANRLHSLTNEVRYLKHKLSLQEKGRKR